MYSYCKRKTDVLFCWKLCGNFLCSVSAIQLRRIRKLTPEFKTIENGSQRRLDHLWFDKVRALRVLRNAIVRVRILFVCRLCHSDLVPSSFWYPRYYIVGDIIYPPPPNVKSPDTIQPAGDLLSLNVMFWYPGYIGASFGPTYSTRERRYIYNGYSICRHNIFISVPQSLQTRAYKCS